MLDVTIIQDDSVGLGRVDILIHLATLALGHDDHLLLPALGGIPARLRRGNLHERTVGTRSLRRSA